jgi:hypothetical protein
MSLPKYQSTKKYMFDTTNLLSKEKTLGREGNKHLCQPVPITSIIKPTEYFYVLGSILFFNDKVRSCIKWPHCKMKSSHLF